jgi:starvation-inducible outer membrane lipoprotein
LKKLIFSATTVIVIITVVFMLTACEGIPTDGNEKEFTTGTVITLSTDTWANGAITLDALW